MLFCGSFSFVKWGRGLATLLLFLYVTEEVGRKCVWDMPWPLAAECIMITNKQTPRKNNPMAEENNDDSKTVKTIEL